MSRSAHLLRVDAEPEVFAPLFAAAAAAGLRIGWLELAAPAQLPAALESAAAAGAMRAVAAGGGRTVAVKSLRGEAVLRDLLREHFAGCALVLVRGDVAAPRLERLEPTDPSDPSDPSDPPAPAAPAAPPAPPDPKTAAGATETWRLELEAPIRPTTAELIARLRKPRLG